MEYSVEIEQPSKILRKLKVTVAATEVDSALQRSLADIQRKAKIKGFRPGKVPLAIVKKYYGHDAENRVMNGLIDQSLNAAMKEQKLRTVGRPTIDSIGTEGHAHIHEGEPFIYTATVEIMPEVKAKDYLGFKLKRENVEVSDKDVSEVLTRVLDSRAQLIPLEKEVTSKGDFIDFEFKGGLVTENGIEEREDMKGSNVYEIGSEGFLPEFDKSLEGVKKTEPKTFRITFPDDYNAEELRGKQAEFTVTVKEIKKKELPELNDELAKEMGHENGVSEMKTKIKEDLKSNRENEAQRKLKSELINELIKKNPFEVPNSLVEAQTQHLAQDFARTLKRQGMDEKSIQQWISSDIQPLKEKAETQVKAGLLLEAIAEQEKIVISEADVDAEIEKMAKSMNFDVAQFKSYYASQSAERENLEFRLKEDRTVQFLLEKAQVK